MRVLQYLPALAARGISVEVSPLFSNEYLRRLYAGRRQSLVDLGRAYGRRLKTLVSPGSPDVVWVQKEALPFAPALVERLVDVRYPTVFDLDDAWHLRYHEHRSMLVRAGLGDKVQRAMRAASVVVAGNRHLADVARAAGAKHVEVIPSVVPHERYTPVRRPSSDVLRVGWIGSPSTVHYLEDLRPVLEELATQRKLVVRVVGAPFRGGTFDVEAMTWSEATEAESLSDIDVGLMPLRSTPWELGKCAYKIVQYMAAGKPVVASDVGANRDVVVDGVTGILASTTSEWIAALEKLTEDTTRARMGQAAREAFRSNFSVEAQVDRLAACLRAAAGR